MVLSLAHHVAVAVCRVQADAEKSLPFAAVTALRVYLLRKLGWGVWAQRAAEVHIAKYTAPAVLLM